MQQKSQHCCSDSFSPLVLFFFFFLLLSCILSSPHYFPFLLLSLAISFQSHKRVNFGLIWGSREVITACSKFFFLKYAARKDTPCFHFLLLGQNVGDFNEPNRIDLVTTDVHIDPTRSKSCHIFMRTLADGKSASY